ncbi:SRPBCC family protein [Herbiconiux sp. YIM B11900]|uniref:SRPBCC family protein n=1 Tax=Herbiconiux sp. YIM B11900 TaxID=3404131 RepID=UPI003F83F37B
MTEAQHTVTIDAPIAAVYQRWLDVGTFGSFMPAVREVTVSSDFYSHWTLSIGGRSLDFDTEIIEQLPEERVRWRAITGDVDFVGTAVFEETAERRTTLTVTIVWTPSTAAARGAAALGVDDRALKAALRAFAQHVEGQDDPPGHSYVTLRSVDAKTAD